jgi:AraC-type DNA-binding domain-containing proteins
LSKGTVKVKLGNMYLFNELSEHIQIRVNAANTMNHPADWIESKQHPDYDLWYLREGTIELRIRDQVHVASAGDLIFFSPTVAYTASSLGAGCRFAFIHFDFSLGNQLRILDNYPISGILSSSLVEEELPPFLEAHERYSGSAPMSGIRLKGALTVLLAKIMERLDCGDYRGSFAALASDNKRTANLEALQPVLSHIEVRLHLPLRVAELAEVAGMSEKYFILYFKQALGITPGAYVYQLKMNRARELLYSRTFSIQQIAERLGYPDPFSFSKAFKKYYKVPPSRFVW